MTAHNLERTAIAAIASQPKSTVYARSRRSGQGVSERLLERDVSSIQSSASDRPEQQLLYGVLAPGWYLQSKALIERHFGQDEQVDQCATELGISLQVARLWAGQAMLVGDSNLKLKFRRAKSSNALYPREPATQSVRRLAANIAVQLDLLVRQDPEMVKDAIALYTDTVRKDNRLILRAQEQAPRLRNWIRMVRGLQATGLSLRMIGFKVRGVKPDLKPKMRLLNLPRSIPIHWVDAPNQNSDSSLSHLGIDVVCRLEQLKNPAPRSSEAFRYVMAIAAIVQLWSIPSNPPQKLPRPVTGAKAPVQEKNLDLPFVNSGAVAVFSASVIRCPVCRMLLPRRAAPPSESLSSHSVFMHFVKSQQQWLCHFLEADLVTPLKKTRAFADDGTKLLKTASRAGATVDDLTNIKNGIAAGNGGTWLALKDEQYEKLQR